LSGERVERRLSSDPRGGHRCRLMGRGEAGTLARVRALRRELIDLNVSEHKGRIVDGILIEFPSVVEAIAAAVARSSDGQAGRCHSLENRIDRRVRIASAYRRQRYSRAIGFRQFM